MLPPSQLHLGDSPIIRGYWHGRNGFTERWGEVVGGFVEQQDIGGHEIYVAVRITGSVSSNLAVVVPGCDRDGWYPEYALPERDLLPAEQAWSNLMAH
jgi:hypothetical protein